MWLVGILSFNDDVQYATHSFYNNSMKTGLAALYIKVNTKSDMMCVNIKLKTRETAAAAVIVYCI